MRYQLKERRKQCFLPFEIKETEYELISLTVSHRNEPLNLEVWNPSLGRKLEKIGFC